jgi:hypothetical protein
MRKLSHGALPSHIPLLVFIEKLESFKPVQGGFLIIDSERNGEVIEVIPETEDEIEAHKNGNLETHWNNVLKVISKAKSVCSVEILIDRFYLKAGSTYIKFVPKAYNPENARLFDTYDKDSVYLNVEGNTCTYENMLRHPNVFKINYLEF